MKYPTKLINADTNIIPQVQMKKGQGIPRLLPGPGVNGTASRKNTHASLVAAFVTCRLG